ncbi:MAG: heme-binding protein [Lewinellaceae bacterium]|nr:heme-binding protein [Saprospiraceae bacterium]MCB9340192.1 heme-binding protein [Lewinellaceae bacterium]
MKQFIILLALGIFSLQNAQAQQVNETYELTLAGAKDIMAAAMAYAKDHKSPGAAVAIVDAAGTLVLLERLDGTFLISSEVSLGKARSAALFRFPTINLENAINNGRPALISTGEVALKGGIPITYKGKIIGGIGVSGVASADQDVEIAMAGLRATFLQ